jgi:hypothetical protein
MNDDAPPPFVLRDLPTSSRLVLAAFLISVGVGYFSALVQLHFQGASPGKALPGPEDAIATYFGRPPMSQIERLLTTDESKPFNGSGSMRAAFTMRSGGLPRAVKEKAKELKLDPTDAKQNKKARAALFSERDGERLALLAWIRAGTPQKEYDEDSFPLPAKWADHPITEKYVKAEGTRTVMIRSVLEDRCVRCHSAATGGPASNFPLDTFERVHDYSEVETVGGGMSLQKLAQTTHVHLLGFAMLYGMTGLIFTFTSYPGWFRLLLGPFTLIAQMVDISCWWVARTDPIYAKAIIFTGGAVGVSLFLQIVLSLFNLFSARGKRILVLLIVIGCLGGYLVHKGVIAPYLENERGGGVPSERTGSAAEE